MNLLIKNYTKGQIMKKRFLYGSITLSTALIIALGGCGSTSNTNPSLDDAPVEIERISPFVSQTLTPSDMPNFDTSEEKSVRALVAIGIDKTVFEKNNVATITLKDMPGRYDWIGLFHKGDVSKKENLLTYTWTGDFKNGTVKINMVNSLKRHTQENIIDGDYEIRAFTNSGSYKELARTSIKIETQDNNAFNPQVSLDSTQNSSWQKIPISLNGLAEFDGEWVGIFPKDSSNDWGNALEWEWTKDAQNGKISLLGVPAGEYDIRVFYDEDMELETSVAITVSANENTDTTISTYQNNFEEGERITIHFEGMPGNNDDKIAIFNLGADNDIDNAITLEWTNGLTSGDISLDPMAVGDYEVRAYHSGEADPETTLEITVSEDVQVPENKKVALFADEHDPHNRLLAVDYGNMELIEEIPVEGSLTHHSDVVGDVETAEHILMIPKGSTFINVYTVKDREFVKKINLPFKPRSADAFNANKNLVLLPSSSRPAAVLIDAEDWDVVGTVGMNVSCDLKFNKYNYLPWYYKSIVYKRKNVDNPKCVAPDFGGSQISGHPIWIDNNHFSVLDRANRLIHVYKLVSKDSNGQWKTKLTDVVPTSTSLHQMVPSGLDDNIFYGMTEGNGNNKGIAPVIYKWKFENGKLKQLNKTSLVTTQTVNIMKNVGAYTAYTSYWDKYVASKNYYKYYYPTNFPTDYNQYYPGNEKKYYSSYYNGYNSYYTQNIKNYSNYYTQNCSIQIQQQFNSLGGHNLYISPFVNGKQYLWGAVASGQTFVVDTASMGITSVVKSDQGAGHVDFQQNGDYAVITNHKSRNVTIANYKTQEFVTNINLPYENENIFSVLQSHSPYITQDDEYFHNSWTDGGVFFRINLDTLELDDDNVYTGGIPIQGNYFPNYKGD